MHIRALPYHLAEGAVATSGNLKDVQILRTGAFFDERYGDFEITRKMFTEMISNFKSGIRGVVPALDYAHETEGVAAGWFKDIYEANVSGDQSELWAKIDFTPRGQKTLADKEFGYLSADFDTEYIDNESGKKFGCVLLGAGLTNRPVIKKMAPAIQLTEKQNQNTKEGNDMSQGQDKEKELADLKAKCADQEQQMASMKKMSDVSSMDPEALKKMIADCQAALAKLGGGDAGAKPAADDSAQMGAMKQQMSEMKSQLEKTQKQLAEAKLEKDFNAMLSEGRVVEAQRIGWMKQDMVEFAKNQGSIKLTEQGHGGRGTGSGDDDVQTEIQKKAKKLSEESKMPIGKAIAQVLKENPELSKKYQGKGA